MVGRISYGVLYGKNGTRGFARKTEALTFARRKAHETKKTVSIDKLDNTAQWHWRHVRPGEYRTPRRSAHDNPFGSFRF